MLALAALPALRRTDSLRAPAIAVGAFLGLIAVAGIAAFTDPSIVPRLPAGGHPRRRRLPRPRRRLLPRRRPPRRPHLHADAPHIRPARRRRRDLARLRARSRPPAPGRQLGVVDRPRARAARRHARRRPDRAGPAYAAAVAPASSATCALPRSSPPRRRSSAGACVRSCCASRAKDRSTEEHTRRVAELAVQIGEQLGLAGAPAAAACPRRAAARHGQARGARSHPRQAGPAQRRGIRRHPPHPAWGRELLSELGGFPPLVFRLVESHHERLDAAATPIGRAAGELGSRSASSRSQMSTTPSPPRASTAPRGRRRAFRLLADEAGVAFDPRCVDALERLVGVAGPELRLAA